MKSTIVSGVVALFLSGFAGQVFAQLNPAGTPAEQALLPRYCQVKLKDDNTTPEAKSFVSQFGFANWLHLHHYCYALNYLNRANKAGGAKARDSLRRSAAADYRYVLGKSRPDFWMRPQLLVELGRLHIQLNEPDKAIPLFRDAIASSRSYVPGYVALVAQLRGANSNSAALDVATEGLRHVPDSEVLRKAYLELGGKEPFPAPAAASRPESPAPSAEEARPAPAQAETGSSGDGVARAPDGTAEEAGKPVAEETVPDSGCRFCPPDEIQERWRESFNRGSDR